MKTQKITYQNTNGDSLVANYSEALDNKALVILIHGITADKDSKGRYTKITEQLVKNGFGVFAFDFSGCGESADTVMSAASLCDDLKSTIRYVSQYNSKIILWGHSIGSIAALKCWNETILSMVLTGVCAGPMNFDWNEYFSHEQMDELKHSPYFMAKSASKYRNKIKISGDIIKFLEDFDQRSILSEIASPCLLINGDQEIEEETFRKITEKAMKFMNSQSKHIILQGANHGMNEFTEQIASLGIDWINQSIGNQNV